MQKWLSSWMVAIFAVLSAFAAAFQCPAHAQQAAEPPTIRHLDSQAMSAADRAAVDAHLQDLIRTAAVYAYNLGAGNWTYEQTLCAPLSDAFLLHYSQDFPDGTASLFTAVIPRHAGRVRIVPVLYHSTTPFLPAPKNPHNYALFNELISTRDRAPSTNWLALSACYAELTGSPVNLASDSTQEIGIAAAPTATVHLNVQNRSTLVTLATRESNRTYKVWSIAFTPDGRVVAATTEDRSVMAEKNLPASGSATLPAETRAQPTPPALKTAPVEAAARTPQPAFTTGVSSAAPTPKPQPRPITSKPAPQPATASVAQPPGEYPDHAASPTVPAPGSSAGTRDSSEPGWIYVLHPLDPPSAITSQAAPPKEKTVPEPPDPTQSSSSPGGQPH